MSMQGIAVTTPLKYEELLRSGQEFGLSKEDFDALTIHEFENEILQVTAYPANANGKKFLEQLLHLNQAILCTP